MAQFGYDTVSDVEKTRRVHQVFASVAERYDVMNDLMSFGIHRLWKRVTVELAGLRPGQQVLDLAGGTGDLAGLFCPHVGATGQVTLADINGEMLRVGRDRLADRGLLDQVRFVQANAEALPWAANRFDCVTIGFGLRNVTHKERALAEMWRVLKPGGRLLILEFSQPIWPGLKPLYDVYSFTVLPALGQWIANDSESYRYLAESIRVHPDQETLKQMMITAQFEQCAYFNLTGGIVALHRGYKV